MAKRENNVLTDVALRQLVRAGEVVAKSDGGGLTFTLSGAGAAAWVLRFSHGGRRHELTLGKYPDLGLAAARKMASSRRVDVQSTVFEPQPERAFQDAAELNVLIGRKTQRPRAVHFDPRRQHAFDFEQVKDIRERIHRKSVRSIKNCVEPIID